MWKADLSLAPVTGSDAILGNDATETIAVPPPRLKSPLTPLNHSAGNTQHPVDEPKSTSRDLIEALRMGIVHDDLVEELTFGRDNEIEIFKSWLNNDQIGSMFLAGEYGSGKTHLLAYFRHVALENGYAVANIALHSQDTTFWKPKQMYRGIAQSFQYPSGHGRRGDFLQYLSSLAESTRALDQHMYLGEVLRRLRAGRLSTIRRNWIMGRESRAKPNLPEPATAWNIYSHILTAVSWASSAVMGLKGLIIMLDEAESVDASYLTTPRRFSNQNNLNALLLACADHETLVNERITRSDGRVSGYFGQESGLMYNARCRVPFVHGLPTRLKCVVDFADAALAATHMEERANTLTLPVGVLNEEALKRVLDHIRLLYEEAYGYETSDDVERVLLNMASQRQARVFVKAAVEALDLIRHGSVDSPLDLELS